jgi:hypothetical protein
MIILKYGILLGTSLKTENFFNNSSLFLEGRKVPDYCNLAESKKFIQDMIVGTVGAKYKQK